MRLTMLKSAAWYYPRSVFATLGLFWLVIEPVIGLTGKSIDLTYWQLFGASAAFGLVWLVIDGLYFSGFFKQSIEIKCNGFDTRIVIKFADIFEQDGWKAIAVNDFFDSIVDDQHISSNSLHGTLLRKYWGGNTSDWDRQVDEQLSGDTSRLTIRNTGKQYRYTVGATAAVRKDGQKFLCVALGFTDENTHETSASSTDLHRAIRGLLIKARTVCANEPLSIPLIGAGLSRVGIKNNILVDLILVAIFEETKVRKITNEIRIILPVDKASEISLANLKSDWS